MSLKPVSPNKVREVVANLKVEDRRLAKKWLGRRGGSRPTGKEFSTDEKRELARLYRAGMTYREIEACAGLVARNGNNAYDAIQSVLKARAKATKAKAKVVAKASKPKAVAKAKPAKAKAPKPQPAPKPKAAKKVAPKAKVAKAKTPKAPKVEAKPDIQATAKSNIEQVLPKVEQALIEKAGEQAVANVQAAPVNTPAVPAPVAAVETPKAEPKVEMAPANNNHAEPAMA